MLARMWSKGNTSLMVGVWTCIVVTLEVNMVVSQKVGNWSTSRPSYTIHKCTKRSRSLKGSGLGSLQMLWLNSLVFLWNSRGIAGSIPDSFAYLWVLSPPPGLPLPALMWWCAWSYCRLLCHVSSLSLGSLLLSEGRWWIWGSGEVVWRSTSTIPSF